MVTQGNWWMWEAKRKNEVISKGTSSFSFCLSFDFWIQSNKRPQRRKTLADWLGGLVETNRNNIFCTNNQPATRSLFNNLRWITLFNLFFICFFFFGYSTRVDCHFFFHKFADDVVRSPRSLAFQIIYYGELQCSLTFGISIESKRSLQPHTLIRIRTE